MERLPAEVFRNIGSHLGQQDYKSCTLVCKIWSRIFSPLVFAKVLLTTRPQVESYLQQADILKRQTVSLHLVAPISDEEFREFVDKCPMVKDLTVFSNYSNKLKVDPAISLISQHWASSLIKIRMDSLLMPKVLKFLAHQLQDITGDLDDLRIPDTLDMYSFPKLHTLEIENGDESGETTTQFLNQLHTSCPKLKHLTISFMRFPVFPTMYQNVEPISLSSFHLKNCDGIIQENAVQLLRIFPNLNALSLLRTESIIRPALVDVTHSLHNAYLDISHQSPKLRNLSIDYVYGNLDTQEFFKNLYSSLTNLHTLHVELSCEIAAVSLREKLSLSNILTNAPQLKKLSIYGLGHLVTLDGLDQYCVGKADHYDNRVRRVEQYFPFEDEDSTPPSPSPPPPFPGDDEDDEDENENVGENMDRNNPYIDVYVVEGRKYALFLSDDGKKMFGEAEVLVEEGSEVMLGAKMSARESIDKTHKYWNVPQQPRMLRSFTMPTIGVTSALTVLELDMVTMRNPTFRWINTFCPYLTDLSMLNTDAYPWCLVYLKDLKKLKRVKISFELFYDVLPVLLIDGVEDTPRIFTPTNLKSKTYIEDPEFEHADLENLYKITLSHSGSLERFYFGDCKVI